MEEGIQIHVFLSQQGGMVGIRASTFQAIDDQFLETCNVVAKCLFSYGDAHLACLDQESIEALRRQPGCWSTELLGCFACFRAGLLIERPCPLQLFCSFLDGLHQAVGIEVHIGQGDEECLHYESIDIDISGPEFSGPVRVYRDPLHNAEEQIL